MGFWNSAKPSLEETARFKRLYEELGSLQAVADREGVSTGWLGRLLLQHDRYMAGSASGAEHGQR